MPKINLAEFQSVLNQMQDLWPGITHQARAKRIYNAVADLELDIVQNIANHFMDSFQKMPLPSDFLEAAKAFKKHYFEKTGQYYNKKESKLLLTNFVPSCSYCCDTGFEWVEINGCSVFCFCFCKEGDKNRNSTNWLFPISGEITGIRKKIFPSKAFLPSLSGDIKKADREIFNVVKRFNEALKESQDFWRHYFSKS